MASGRGGRVTLHPSRGSKLTLLVAGPPDRSGGVGGWESSDRNGRRPAKWHKEVPDDALTWDLIIDIDEVDGPPLDRRLQVLYDMGVPGGHDEPPHIDLTGDVSAHDKAISWVLDDVAQGDRLWTTDGKLRQLHVSVSLSRYSPVTEIEAVRVKPTRGRSRKSRRRSITTHAGDTLRAVALRELGNASRWQDLRGWNRKLSKTRPDDRLRTGTTIVLH